MKLTHVTSRIVAVFAALAAAVSIAAAQPAGVPPFGRGSGGEGPGFRGRLFEDLGLSEAQKNQIRALHERKRPMREQHKALQEKRDALMDEIKSPNTDEQKVLSLVEEINRAHAEMNTARVKNLLEMKKILTAEQFTALTDRIREQLQQRGGPGGERENTAE